MSEKTWTAIRAAVVAAAFGLAVVALYVWYNKDRYQFVDGHSSHLSAPSVFDRNTGAIR